MRRRHLLPLLTLACWASTWSAHAEPAATPRVQMETSLGTVVLELDADKAPQTVDNFLQYVRAGHYNGTVFHRVIPGFMVQGGGFTPALEQKPTRAPIPLESRNGLRNARGTIAMARTMDPHSATAQFFINLSDNRFLDQDRSRDGAGYAVFGRVVSGMDVIDRMATQATGSRGMHENVPVQAITILNLSLKQP